MPATIKSVLLFISIIVFCTSSCKKNSSDSPGTKSDTLSNGWTRLPPISNFNVNSNGGDIFFIDQYTGYVSSGLDGTFIGGILKSTDGGMNWQPLPTTHIATNLAMTPDKKLFAVGYNDSMYRVSDGGTTAVPTNLGMGRSIDVFFLNNQAGLCTSTSNLFLTNNGGDSWSNIHGLPNIDSSYGQNSVIAMSGTNAWIGYSRYILHSNGNNYSSWDLDSLPTTLSTLGIAAISAPTPDIVYVISFSGYIYKSTDGGNSFNFIYKADNVYNNSLTSDIHFVTATTGHISVGSRIYKTTDGGNNWTTVVAIGTFDFLEIHFVDENHGWGLCFDASVVKLN